MAGAAPTRLLDPGGGVALVGLTPFTQQLLTWLLIWAVALGALHLLLSLVRGRLPIVLFCLMGGIACSAAGLFVLWDVLRANAERSFASALLWGPGFALGLFVVGVLGSGAWVVVTQGLKRALSRRPSEPEASPEGAE